MVAIVWLNILQLNMLVFLYLILSDGLTSHQYCWVKVYAFLVSHKIYLDMNLMDKVLNKHFEALWILLSSVFFELYFLYSMLDLDQVW